MKNIRKVIIITVLGLALILTGLFLLKAKPKEKTNQSNTTITEIANNMSQASSYNIAISMKYKDKEIATTGTIRRTKGFNYFRGLIDIEVEDTTSANQGEKLEYQSDIEYIFDLAEQRYKQNIYYQDNLIATNNYDSSQPNQNIDLIDSTNILSIIADFITDEQTTCNNTTCQLNLSKLQISRLYLLTANIVNQHISSCLLDQEQVKAIFKIDSKNKEIQAVDLITSKNETINIKFNSFKF